MISDTKIQAALNSIKERQEKTFITASIQNCLDLCNTEIDAKKVEMIAKLESVFAEISERYKDNSLEVYKATVESLSQAIDEHATILVEHAKEVLKDK